TYQHAQFAKLRIPHAIAEIAGGEVELLIEARIFGDVHLAELPHESPVGVEDGGRIVINARRALLEEAGDNDHAQFASEIAETLRRVTRHRLREVEESGVLTFAKVGREKQLLEAPHLRALLRRLADERD